VLLRFAERWSTAHAQILDRASKACRQVGLEVGYYYHAVGRGNLSRDLSPAEMLSVDCHLLEIVSSQAVGNDDRSPGNRWDETVIISRLQMIDAIGSTASVERVRIGQKRPASQ
jgi:hypothetical protein